MSFSGFTDDDIRKISQNDDAGKSIKESHNKSNQKRVSFKIIPKTNNKEKKIKELLHNSITTTDIPEDAKLELHIQPTDTEPKIFENNQSNVNTEATETPENDQSSLPNQTPETNHHHHSISVQLSEKRCIDLDEFEARQKLIEEQNRKRKELLAKALADRTKRTQEEAQRLQVIQDEFKKLDALLSNDVKILRKQIEIASVEYMECQKKYHRIEKEFLDAKLMLHQKLEKKDMLTEHLCAIIEKNEERKAEKLMELLKKLEMISVEDDNCVDGI